MAGNSKVLRDGATKPSSCLICGEVVCRLRLELFRRSSVPNDVRFRDVEETLRESGIGLEPDWKGLSSVNGLSPSSNDSRFSLGSGSLILTDGVLLTIPSAWLFLDFRVEGLGFSASVSVSDARGCFDELCLVLGVLDLLEVDGVVVALPALMLDLLLRLRGVFGTGGGGISSSSPSSSPSIVLS